MMTANYNLGFSLIRLGHSRAAIPHLEIEKKVHPDDEDVALELGRTLVRSERVVEGIAEVERAGKLDSEKETIKSYYQQLRKEHAGHFKSEG